MNIREANKSDIKSIQKVRNSVNENKLSDPSLISDKDCLEYITKRGKGWVFENNNEIIGFSIIDLSINTIWALFVKPEYEKRGIGKKLHNTMLNWYFEQTKSNVSLSTSKNTRAETFYRTTGWIEIGEYDDGEEIKFLMPYTRWKFINNLKNIAV